MSRDVEQKSGEHGQHATLPQVLADLHVHLYGCIRATDMLDHLSTCEDVEWDWYEREYEAAYGHGLPTRQLVDRSRAGDESSVKAFTDLYVVGEADAASFARFQAKSNLKWATNGLHAGAPPP